MGCTSRQVATRPDAPHLPSWQVRPGTDWRAPLGVLGELHPLVQDNYDLPFVAGMPVQAAADLDLRVWSYSRSL